eukprot:11601380-Alexandrium_andersonii.AAC.1
MAYSLLSICSRAFALALGWGNVGYLAMAFSLKLQAVKTEATPVMAPPEGTGEAAAAAGSGAAGDEAAEPVLDTGCDISD